MIKSNYHVHSTYCDGKNTLEENVKEAIKLGFTSLGFSSHTQPPFSNYSMSHSMRDEYIKEIYNLKKKYESQIGKMKCCENCKHHHFIGDELKCYLDYDTEFECLKTRRNWELAE